jgi:A/G-specific adenine glycosylase
MSSEFDLPIGIGDFAASLLAWYRQNRRDLPWRSRSDPYRVWLSEVMLQQTRVSSVIPYFQRFLELYPKLEDLARSSEEEVLDAWSGLGYYSRARNLRRAAQLIIRDHDGKFPKTHSEAVALPGIGPYTAGAILSIAYGQPHPVLDGNVRRVLARYLGINQPLTQSVVRQLWRLVTEMVSSPQVSRRVSDFNQAFMELGATVCVPRNPRCSQCPLREHCQAWTRGIQSELPLVISKGKSVELHFTSAVVRQDGRFLMHRNVRDPYLKGFWEFPKIEGRLSLAHTAEAFKRIHRLNLLPLGSLDPVRHQITFRKLHFYPCLAQLTQNPPERFRWVQLGGGPYPVSSYVRKILKGLRKGVSI